MPELLNGVLLCAPFLLRKLFLWGASVVVKYRVFVDSFRFCLFDELSVQPLGMESFLVSWTSIDITTNQRLERCVV